MNIGICGNTPLNRLAHALDAALPGHQILVGDVGFFSDELTYPVADFINLDYCIIALSWNDLVPKIYHYGYGDDADAIAEHFRTACEKLTHDLTTYRSKSSARILLFSPIAEVLHPTGFINRQLKPSPSELWYNYQKMFNELCKSISDVYPVDLDELSSRTGKDAAISPEVWDGVLSYFSSAFTCTIASHLAYIILQFTQSPIKCLVFDLDNTVWGGIVGESGMNGIVLSDNGMGALYKNLQQEILKVHKQGILLAICSKNNTCDALEAMEQHPHMILKPNLISSMRINWDNKPKNIQGIAAELNIGLDTIAFLDDDPAERAMVCAMLPDVAVINLPHHPERFTAALKSFSRLWPTALTLEDTKKVKLYQQGFIRGEAQRSAPNLEAYLTKSNITVSINFWTPESLSRIVQLFQKINQFNLTTIRYSQTELENLLTKKENVLLSMDMADAYGEYGTIAAALLCKNTIDSFVLSCRAFGRQVENVLLSHILTLLQQQGYAKVLGNYLPTLKNTMAKDFYQNAGFTIFRKGSENQLQTWKFTFKTSIPEIPHWISLLNNPM